MKEGEGSAKRRRPCVVVVWSALTGLGLFCCHFVINRNRAQDAADESGAHWRAHPHSNYHSLSFLSFASPLNSASNPRAHERSSSSSGAGTAQPKAALYPASSPAHISCLGTLCRVAHHTVLQGLQFQCVLPLCATDRLFSLMRFSLNGSHGVLRHILGIPP